MKWTICGLIGAFVILFIYCLSLQKEINEIKESNITITYTALDGIKGALIAQELDKMNSANIAALMEIIKFANWDSYNKWYDHYFEQINKPKIKGYAGVYTLNENKELNLEIY